MWSSPGACSLPGIWPVRLPIIEKSLQNQCSGHLIDHAPMFLAGMAGLVEDMVGFLGSQALVAKVNGQAGKLAQLGGKGAGFGGLRAFFAGEVQRKADDQAGHAEAAGEPGQRAEVFAPISPSFQREDRLRGESQLVGDGYPDAAIADIKAEKPRVGALAQRFPPGFKLKGAARPRTPICIDLRRIESNQEESSRGFFSSLQA